MLSVYSCFTAGFLFPPLLPGDKKLLPVLVDRLPVCHEANLIYPGCGSMSLMEVGL